MTLEATARKWQITPALKERVAEIRKGIESDRKEFEKSTPPCPTHQKPGKFSRYEGVYTRGFAIFKCPEGHEFKIG